MANKPISKLESDSAAKVMKKISFPEKSFSVQPSKCTPPVPDQILFVTESEIISAFKFIKMRKPMESDSVFPQLPKNLFVCTMRWARLQKLFQTDSLKWTRLSIVLTRADLILRRVLLQRTPGDPGCS